MYYVYTGTYVEYDKINGIVKRYQNVTDQGLLIREGLTETNDGIELLERAPPEELFFYIV